MTPQALIERQLIQDLLVRYCHALDERDWLGFHALFTADATLDFRAFGGPCCGVAEMQAYLGGVLASMRGCQHTLSTSRVDLAGDEARVRSAAQVMMVSAGPQGQDHVLFAGLWYRDHLVRGPDGWRIRRTRPGIRLDPQAPGTPWTLGRGAHPRIPSCRRKPYPVPHPQPLPRPGCQPPTA